MHSRPLHHQTEEESSTPRPRFGHHNSDQEVVNKATPYADISRFNLECVFYSMKPRRRRRHNQFSMIFAVVSQVHPRIRRYYLSEV